MSMLLVEDDGGEQQIGIRDNEIAALKEKLAKSESLTSEAVAREAARWSVEMEYAWQEFDNHAGKIYGGSKTRMAKATESWRRLRSFLNGNHADWLAKHDAEVLRPWRDALEDIVETGCGLIHEDSCCLTESGVIGDIKDLLSQTPAPSEERL